jgi:TonB family protein
MRRTLIALAFVPALAFAVNPATLETRSADHALVVDVTPVGLDVNYTVRVTDLHTGELMAVAKFTASGGTGDSVVEYKDTRVRIHLQPTYNGVFASAQVEKDSMVLDSMDARWSLRPAGLGLPRANRPPFTTALRVGGEVKAPTVISKVEPEYSEEARRARISGIVILEALIDKNGNVTDINVLKPLPFGLDQAAIDAVKQWKFKPAMMNGQPVDVVFNLTVNFKLDGGKPPMGAPVPAMMPPPPPPPPPPAPIR